MLEGFALVTGELPLQPGTPIVYANKLTIKETDESTGVDHEKNIPVMKGYSRSNRVNRLALGPSRIRSRFPL